MPNENAFQLASPRLILRSWRPEDLEGLVSMSNDPRVMEFFPALSTRAECEAIFERIVAHHQKHGFGYWAVEIPGVTQFAGMLGLGVPRFEAHFTPCVEIGWRLMAEVWGHGYATEGAGLALQFAFDTLDLQEVVSMTAVQNLRSRRVMEKLGMKRSADDDFDHPLVPDGHALKRHVLYRIRRHRL